MIKYLLTFISGRPQTMSKQNPFGAWYKFGKTPVNKSLLLPNQMKTNGICKMRMTTADYEMYVFGQISKC